MKIWEPLLYIEHRAKYCCTGTRQDTCSGASRVFGWSKKRVCPFVPSCVSYDDSGTISSPVSPSGSRWMRSPTDVSVRDIC